MMRAPSGRVVWTDADALVVVNEQLDELYRRRIEEANRRPAWDALQLPLAQNAARAARDGDLRPLASLLAGSEVDPQTMAAALRAVAQPRGRGRPKAELAKRMAQSKAIVADSERPDIERILRAHYPDLPDRDYRDWSITLAALRWCMDQETLRNYLKSRRRVRHP